MVKDVLDDVAMVTAPPSLSMNVGGVFSLLHSCIMNEMCVFSVLNYESVSVILSVSTCVYVCQCVYI